MMKLQIKGKEYKVKFGYNCFCDTDLMDRVQDLMNTLGSGSAENDRDVAVMGQIKELFTVVRDLIYMGLKKYNPVDTVQDVGNLLDDYIDEETEEKRGLFILFTELSNELLNEGFLSGLTEPKKKNVPNPKG